MAAMSLAQVCMHCGFESNEGRLRKCPNCGGRSFILKPRDPMCFECVYLTVMRGEGAGYYYCTLRDLRVRADAKACKCFTRRCDA